MSGAAADTEGSAILEELVAWFGRYIVAPRDVHLLLALWVMHTHALDHGYSTPRLRIQSAVPACGKTLLLEHLQHLCPKGLLGSSATPAMIARVTAHDRRTLLLDEVDNLLDPKREGTPDLLAVLNSGYRIGATRPTLVPGKNGTWKVEELSTFSAVALAGIGDNLPDAIMTRCIVIHLDRARPGERVDTEWRDIAPAARALRDRVAAWVDDNAEAWAAHRPSRPDGLYGRDAEVWDPLLTAADMAGGLWPARARRACQAALQDARDDADAGLGHVRAPLRLLTDLRTIWPGQERWTATADLLDSLHELDPEQWGDRARFSALTAKRLGSLLSGFRVRSSHQDTSHRGRRGYLLADLQPLWGRYLDPSPENPSEASEASEAAQFTLSADTFDVFDASDASPGRGSERTGSQAPAVAGGGW